MAKNVHESNSNDNGRDEVAYRATMEQFIAEGAKRRISFLLAGRTGVGKSSTINALLGREVAPVGDFEPTTMMVSVHDDVINRVPVRVIDTPGLCDDVEEAGNDEKYLEMIRQEAGEVHCLWFVTPLSDTRVTADEKRALQMLSENLGADVWKHAVIVFTFADRTPEGQFAMYLEKRTELIRREIARHVSPAVANRIPSVAVTNAGPQTPDDRYWSGNLLVTVAEVLPSSRVGTILSVVAGRVVRAEDVSTKGNASAKSKKKKEGPIIIDRKDQGRLFEAVGRAVEGAVDGWREGYASGGVLGGAVGALKGAIGGLFGW